MSSTTLTIPKPIDELTVGEARDLLARAHLGVWMEHRWGLRLAPFHWEWCGLVNLYDRGCVVAPRDHAKALGLEERIITPTGTVTVRDVAPGDAVVAPDGRTVTVIGKSPVYMGNDCYRVGLSDGQSFLADAEHRWSVRCVWDSPLSGRRQIRTTSELAEDLTAGARRDPKWRIDLPSAWDPPEADLPVDPYTLGAWLGDGHTEAARITTMDGEIVDRVIDAGYPVSKVYSNGSQASTYAFLGLHRALRLAGVLGQKRVPMIYRRGSVKQRLGVLTGLMDTDGSVSLGGQCIYTTTAEALADDVLDLVRSLGWKATKIVRRATLDGVDHGPVWSIGFYPDEQVFTVPRKTIRLSARISKMSGRPSKSRTRSVISVAPVRSEPTQCITVEGGMFLLDGWVPTCNSTVFSVAQPVWNSEQAGAWTHVITSTGDLAEELRDRVLSCAAAAAPHLVDGMVRATKRRLVWSNGAMVTFGSVGSRTRGLHPDYIIGDDVLSEQTTLTAYQRRKIHTWWFASVTGMAHSRVARDLPDGTKRVFPPTKIWLIGTPFHENDLLASARKNRAYHYRRYAAEYQRTVDGTLAVEVA